MDVMAVLNETDYTIEKISIDNPSAWEAIYWLYRAEDDVIEKLVEWLSFNCIANFVITENRESLLAGGYSDNKLAFINGNQNYQTNRMFRTLKVVHEIHFGSKSDEVAFQLTWIDYNKE